MSISRCTKKIMLRMMLGTDQAIRSAFPPIIMESLSRPGINDLIRWGSGPLSQMAADTLEVVVFDSPEDYFCRKGGGSLVAGFGKMIFENAVAGAMSYTYIDTMQSYKVIFCGGEDPKAVYYDSVSKSFAANLVFQNSRALIRLLTDKMFPPKTQIPVQLHILKTDFAQPLVRTVKAAMLTEVVRQGFHRNDYSIADERNNVAFNLIAIPAVQIYEEGIRQSANALDKEMNNRSELDIESERPFLVEEPQVQTKSSCTLLTVTIYYASLLVTGFTGVANLIVKNHEGTADTLDAVGAGTGGNLIFEGIKGLWKTGKLVNENNRPEQLRSLNFTR